MARMRSYTLNGAAMGAGPEGDDPEGTGFDLPTGGRVIERPSVATPSWDIEKAKKYWEVGKKIYDAGAVEGSTQPPYGEFLTAAASGAAAGAVIAGVGAVVGAIVAVSIVAIKWLCGPRPSAWTNAAPGVHTWFTTYGQQDFLDFLGGAEVAAGFQTVDAAVRAQAMYWLQRYSHVLTPGERFYNNILDDAYIAQLGGGAVVEAIYRDMGIDYPATVELRRTTGGGLMMLKRDFLPAPGAVDEDAGAPDAEDSGDAWKWILGGLAAAVVLPKLARV